MARFASPACARVVLTGVLVGGLAVAPAGAGTNWTPRLRAVCDGLLAQATPHGCIADKPGTLRANRDSAMARALLALALAHRQTQDDRFRRGLRDGLLWLADRMEKARGPWCGSWRFAYSAKPPYLALPTSPCEGVEDARGSSAAGGLFAYLVALYTRFTGDRTLERRLTAHTRLALDFVLERNLGENDLFHSRWHRAAGSSEWERDGIQAAADQALVYLGLRAGYWLHGHTRYKVAAEKLDRAVPKLLFDEKRGAFALGLDPRGDPMPPREDPESYFAQGLLAWTFGSARETEHAVKWLAQRLGPDDTVRTRRGELPYTLSAAAFCMGSLRTGLCLSQRKRVVRLLRDHAVSREGGVLAVLGQEESVQNDLSPWLFAAWLGAQPVLFNR